jgi:hypothetical protein
VRTYSVQEEKEYAADRGSTGEEYSQVRTYPVQEEEQDAADDIAGHNEVGAVLCSHERRRAAGQSEEPPAITQRHTSEGTQTAAHPSHASQYEKDLTTSLGSDGRVVGQNSLSERKAAIVYANAGS